MDERERSEQLARAFVEFVLELHPDYQLAKV